MAQPIALTLKTLPLSVNQTYRQGKGSFYKSQKAKEVQEAMAWEVRAQYRGKPLGEALSLSIAFFWPDQRRHDLDNGLKLLLDSMTGILYLDDSQIHDLKLTKACDRAEPRVELVLEELK